MFSSYLSNGEESEEKDHGNEFRGSKNGGRGVWVGLECLKNVENRRPTLAAAAAFAGSIQVRSAAVGREIFSVSSPLHAPPPWPVRVQGFEIVSHGQNPIGIKTSHNDLIRGPQILGNFSRVLELKMSVLWLGFYLALKNRFIYSLGSFSSKNPGLTWTLLKYSPGP